jgi:V8-like Glu-specific endopeptidase
MGGQKMISRGLISRNLKLAPLAVACAISLTASAKTLVNDHLFDNSKVIYGDDNRRDLYEAQNPMFATLADSTVGLFHASDVTMTNDARANLRLSNFGSSMDVCSDEPYFNQPNGAFCSGSLVAEDIIMTAGHCVRSEEDCKAIKFVFGFSLKAKDQMPTSVAASDVYGCKQLIVRKQIGTGFDYALVKLDRAVTGHAPLKLNTAAVASNAPLVVIGHPSGLPTKIADGASVRDAHPVGFFVANLDTYGGNSGSAVFNTQTGLVEGILVRGENDFVYRGNCRVSNRCDANGCRGEDVTKLDEVLTYIHQ